MKVPNDLLYSNDHEWVKIDGNKAYIGITDFAQHHMGDIVYVELPEVGAVLEESGIAGTVESFKSTSDVLSPVAGTVLEVNNELTSNPALINEDPYKNWIAVLEVSEYVNLGNLMNAAEYESFCAKEE
ncbi:MAG TPA: glycine cleavage system protein GcvH [Clostridia bacterium]|nr:glycine cleavage system protein GcvH [Clostridia bacterium]